MHEERKPDSPEWSQPHLLGDRLRSWCEDVPDWNPAQNCRSRVEQFTHRTSAMQKRLGMPLIVAFLGGTGTGKSTLINALLGSQIVKEGKQRPTTDQPILLCRPEIEPLHWGIDTSDLRVEKHDLPSLQRTVLIDCPDPDTTEDEKQRLSNLARLRSVLPLCDILIITGTQQKYRSRKVAEELAEAAPGARLIFVQTHADKDVDVREDWAGVLREKYDPGTLYFVDSRTALQEQMQGKELSGDFALLHRLLTRDMKEEHALKIREANYFDLAEETAGLCWEEIDSEWSPLQKLSETLEDQRRKLGQELSEKMRGELQQDRRLWENRLVGQLTDRWGYSPFSIVLRTYQRLGSLAMGMALARARSIPQLAALGTVQGIRTLRKWSDRRKEKEKTDVSEYWEENDLRESNLVVSGFARDAHIPPESPETFAAESIHAGDDFARKIGLEMQSIVQRLCAKNSVLPLRIIYETLITGMLVFVLYRPAHNFFYESFQTGEIWPLGNYVVSVFWFLLFAAAVLGIFLLMLNRGLDAAIREISGSWSFTDSMRRLYSRMELTMERIREFREQLRGIRLRIEELNRESRSLDQRLGRRK